MGVTIHFEGRLKDDQSLAAVIDVARRFSEAHDWPLEAINKPQATLLRVREEQDWDYVGPVRGIEIQPHEDSDPFKLEFDSELYLQEYTKTQFAPIEVHVHLTELLHRLEPFFENLKVDDEGEYFETGDVTLLENHRDRCLEALNDLLSQSSKYYGPIRIEGKRIVDLMERN